jgi:hypothetical protein
MSKCHIANAAAMGRDMAASEVPLYGRCVAVMCRDMAAAFPRHCLHHHGTAAKDTHGMVWDSPLPERQRA